MVEKPSVTSESTAETDRHDSLFRILADSHRRFSLQHLRDANTPITVSELTTEIATWEAVRPVVDSPGDGADAIETALVHNHLPRMAEAGIVEYDAAHGTVALTDRAHAAQSHLDVIENN